MQALAKVLNLSNAVNCIVQPTKYQCFSTENRTWECTCCVWLVGTALLVHAQGPVLAAWVATAYGLLCVYCALNFQVWCMFCWRCRLPGDCTSQLLGAWVCGVV